MNKKEALRKLKARSAALFDQADCVKRDLDKLMATHGELIPRKPFEELTGKYKEIINKLEQAARGIKKLEEGGV